MSSKETIHKAKMAVARWFFDANIPFNAIKSPYFQDGADAIAAIGPGFKVPTFHDIQVNLLGYCKRECSLLIESYRSKWAKNGCTIMADGWSDQKQRTLINFLVYCPQGMVFVKSIDASDVVKDAATLCNMFTEVIEWVGHENIVHDICNLPHVAELASKASKVTVFVYNHMIFLSWLRKREGWKEIVRPGLTRFATTFITLKSMYDHKHDLQALMVDKHFTTHKLAKSVAGKTVSAIILDSKFWDDCFKIAKLMAPIIKLLRIVDGDEVPSMGYVYEGMRRAKNAIKEMFKKKKAAYEPYTNIIKARWDKHLKRNLHAASYFFNPAFLYGDNFDDKSRVMEALIQLIEIKSFCPNMTKALQEIQVYHDRKDSFNRMSAIKVMKTIQPAEWWKVYGGSAPILQKLAIRLLSQTSSSSGCERNWSVFERIHTKRRNRLEHQRLKDLVYVAYNLRLQNRGKPRKICYDPIDYESIDNIDFWVVEEEAPPELDIHEIENLLYHDNAIPIVEDSLRNNQGNEDFDTMEFQVEEDNGVEGDDDGSDGEDFVIPNVIIDYAADYNV
ncbi:hypothetical protein TSUD_413500 [Trifolium subterraneum]|uniref:DUF659 domain-containing protein n=1 Tax=Trifolium subterraneum TaxID=3900 RepID=A0A2Z6P912_TRISU|nr:hypothetical protein TSUD_413500 [Trifolium subterraneum]